MKDLIERQAAIDALMEILDRPNHAEFLYTDEICKTLNELPSAQPVDKDMNVPCTDTISRKAAVDAVSRGCHELRGIFAECEKNLNELPSAQPEIIRCKDCIHRDPEDKKCDSGHFIQWQLPRDDNWFCADAERRTDEGD